MLSAQTIEPSTFRLPIPSATDINWPGAASTKEQGARTISFLNALLGQGRTDEMHAVIEDKLAGASDWSPLRNGYVSAAQVANLLEEVVTRNSSLAPHSKARYQFRLGICHQNDRSEVAQHYFECARESFQEQALPMEVAKCLRKIGMLHLYRYEVSGEASEGRKARASLEQAQLMGAAVGHNWITKIAIPSAVIYGQLLDEGTSVVLSELLFLERYMSAIYEDGERWAKKSFGGDWQRYRFQSEPIYFVAAISAALATNPDLSDEDRKLVIDRSQRRIREATKTSHTLGRTGYDLAVCEVANAACSAAAGDSSAAMHALDRAREHFGESIPPHFQVRIGKILKAL